MEGWLVIRVNLLGKEKERRSRLVEDGESMYARFVLGAVGI